ncbi:hypothetical protein DUI70_0176 [Streptomyces albus]|nr:hypothetical protein DUI70_0176 [Streptomyces albus]
MVKRHRADLPRRPLLKVRERTPQLDYGRAFVLALPAGAKQIPELSRTGATTWSVYTSALKAAAVGRQGHDRGWKFGERELPPALGAVARPGPNPPGERSAALGADSMKPSPPSTSA